MSAFYLIGFRAAGKTTLGSTLANELRVSFVDLDQEWERARGRTILSFVEEHGIEAFRESEAASLREWDERLRRETGGTPRVVALGGGVVDWPASRAVLESSPLAKVYVRVPAEELWSRLESQPERRKIGGLNSFADLERLLALRAPHFEKISTHTVENRGINEAILILKQKAPLLWKAGR